MQPEIRKQYNQDFSQQKYQSFIQLVEGIQKAPLSFRLAETPIFVNRDFTEKLLEAGNSICQQLTEPIFAQLTEKAIPDYARTKNELALPACLVLDFAIAHGKNNNIVPKLIELQGFPSLFAFELVHDEAFRKTFEIPSNYIPFLNGYSRESYIKHFKKILSGVNNKRTILLEIKPEQQKTKIDFYCTEAITGLPIVCISELYHKEDGIYYSKDGISHKVERIYNRMVFEELLTQDKSILKKWDVLRSSNDIEWVTHPHHFFRFSKYSIPFLKGDAIPSTQFLDKIQSWPNQLTQFILKPLFSFAGQGVHIDLTEDIIKDIQDRSNWILQEKVDYASIIDTPTGPTKAEIRLFYFWDDLQQSYTATLNLCRLSKGKMIGVNHNKAATWVGGSLAYFEI